MSKSLSIRGYGIDKNDDEIDIDNLKKSLRVKPNSIPGLNIDQDDKTFSTYLESSKKLYVPKCWGLKNLGVPDVDKIHEPKHIESIFKGNLRDYQYEPVNTYLKACKDPLKRGGILQLPPGWGKTVMALYILSKLNVKTLIIVHKDFLLNQWKDRITEYIDNVSIGIIKQKKVESDNDIVIASLQSISMKDYPKNTFDDFGLTIIDEVHHMAAQVFSRALFKVNFAYSLGLSATVTRKDGLSKVFKWFIGDVIYKAKPKEKDSLDVIMKYYYDSDPNYSKIPLLFNGRPNISKLINNVCEYSPRTEMLVDELDIILKKEPLREVIILSDRRNHLQNIETLLNKKSYDSIGYYVGGMKQADLKISESKRIILGTFNMVSEGFDLPKLNTLVLASPKSDVEQSIGRIQRQLKQDRKHIPLVLDIADQFSLFSNQAKKRNAFYHKKGFNISEIDKIGRYTELKEFAFRL